MATLIPSLSSVLAKMTAGEKRFARRLESHLEDDYLCWYEATIGPRTRRPDFVVLHPRRGLLVVEVKDWKLENIRKLDPVSATLVVNGQEVRAANPLEQARQYVLKLCNHLQSDRALVGEPGSRFPGKLLFPWAYGVALPNITRKAFDSTDLGQVLPPERVICQDDLAESVEPEAFQMRLWQMFPAPFPCLLTLPQIDRIRWYVFPEIRVPAQGGLALSGDAEVEVPDIVRVMDLRQEQLARSMGDGHRVIHGVAGSGKTMILGFRATHLAQAMAKPILVLCYNAALAARLKHMMEERGLGSKVSVRSFHGWCQDQLRLYQVPTPEAEGQKYFEQLVEAVIRGVERGQIPRAQYGAVLIDEGHDFQPEWLKLVAQMVDPETSSLLVLYDDAQSINQSKSRLKFSFAEVGVQARGRTTVLKINYRNTQEVMGVACHFAREVLSYRAADDDGIPLVAPESAGRHGELPKLERLASEKAELEFIAGEALRLHAGGVAWKDMAMLYRMNYQGKRIAEHLTGAKLPVSVFGKGANKRKFNPGEDSIKLITFHSSKGLEFPVVFIPFLETMPHMKDDVPGEAKLLYVAMTRAMDRLYFTHHGDSPFVADVRGAVAAQAWS